MTVNEKDIIFFGIVTQHYKPENKGSLLNFALQKGMLNRMLRDGIITEDEYSTELKRMQDELNPEFREVV